ncbi:MAG: CRISPR-associated endonuclease Cas2 [Clostridiales bacterium]|nr:CRISPR-associated endonuclease Cas2 [Clostridiales bacterium]
MLVLITYDVNTQTDAGRRRLRQVARCCQDHGIRVQCSVFECVLDASELKQLQHRLEGLIDPALDSLRYYTLGNRTERNVRHVGAKPAPDMEDTLIL